MGRTLTSLPRPLLQPATRPRCRRRPHAHCPPPSRSPPPTSRLPSILAPSEEATGSGCHRGRYQHPNWRLSCLVLFGDPHAQPMAPPALLRAAAAELRRRGRRSLPPLPPLSSLLSSPYPQSPASSCPDPSSPLRHLITLRRCPRPPASASALATELPYSRAEFPYTRVLLPSHFSPASPLSTSSPSSEPADKASPPPAPLTWVDKWVPEAARPYAMLARLDKPIGTWLLAWPCMWYVSSAPHYCHCQFVHASHLHRLGSPAV